MILTKEQQAILDGEKGETLADMENLADKVLAFSDDGKGVQSDDMMEKAMEVTLFLTEQKSVAEVADIIQSRVEVYVNEKRM